MNGIALDRNSLGKRAAQLWRGVRHRRVQAVSHLLTGTAATVGLSLISIAFAARALGPAQYGVLALILALGQACERLISFQSWQPLIRYGASLDEETQHDDLRALYKFGLKLDAAGSIGAWAVASGLAVAGHFVLGIGWPVVGVALVYTASLLFNFNGTATAIFRMCDRFRTVARIQVLVALARAGLSTLALVGGGGLLEVVAIWAATQAGGSLLNILMAMRVLRERGIGRVLSADARGVARRFPDIWRFTWGANASLTLWASAQQLDVLIVGWLADPAAAGLFQIAKRVSRMVQQVGSQVEAVVYPDLSRLWAAARRREFVRLIVQTEAVLLGFGIACAAGAALLGGWLVTATAGARFAGAAPLLTVQMMAVALTIGGAASRAALLAMGRQPAVLRTVLAASGAFYLSVAPLIGWIGAMGANVAHLLFGLVWLSGLALALRRGLGSGVAGEAGLTSPDQLTRSS